MNARNRVFVILGLLTIGSFVWFLFKGRHDGALKLVGTVDANEVLVGARIPGRIQHLLVEEGQQVTAGQVIAVIEAQDLEAAERAAAASTESQQGKLAETEATLKQTEGEVENQERSAAANLQASRAAVAQAKAQLERQQADSRRTVALADAGIASQQQKDDAVTSLAAAEAALEAAKEQEKAADATLKQAQAHILQAAAARQTVASTRGMVANAAALTEQAKTQVGYATVVSPVTGKVQVKAAREGEVVTAGQTIVSVIDLSQTWVYVPLPETEGDAVKLDDTLTVVMPSGAKVDGKVISKSTLADFATQRDIDGGRKRDIRTVQLKLLIANEDGLYTPGMTAEVYLGKEKLVHP